MKGSFKQLCTALWIAALFGIGPIRTFAASQTGQTKKKPAATTKKTTQNKKPATSTRKSSTAGSKIKATAKKPAARTPAKKTSATASKPKARPKPSPTPTPVDPAAEKAELDAALTAASPLVRADLLVKFIAAHPRSADIVRARESLSVARASLANEALTGGEIEKSVGLFKLAVAEAPTPFSDKFFSDVLVVIPSNLYFRGQREAGIELAHEIEAAVAADPKKLLELASFYLSTENGAEARRLAEAAAKLDEKSAAPYLTLGMANRLDFNIEGAAAAYSKAIELDPASTAAQRSLAEMKRAGGDPAAAITIYRTLLAADANDNISRTGLVLSLFESGAKAEAEAEMARSLEAVPGNVILLAGAAYWYAANKDGTKAVDLARQAIAKEPRYIWSYIALARGLLDQGKPVDAEQVLVGARKYGNFPTLDFEIASARVAAGFFREAAEEMKRNFTVGEDGTIHTLLGGRVDRGAATFAELLAGERRASTFAHNAADNAEVSARLKSLLEFEQYVSQPKPDESRAVFLAEGFSGGEDNMTAFRKLFAAQALLDKKVAAGKALELAQSAVQYLDRGLNVANPEAATMASELYDARAASFAKNEFLLVPDVPTQTLSALNRGRVEQLSGRALLAEAKAPEAETRFRRALSVFPKDSAWWRSAMWNLGEALEAQGKDEEALKTFISSYKIDKPDAGRYLAIQFLYKKVKGSLDGMEAEVGPNPFQNAIAANTTPATTETPAVAASPSPSPSETPAVEASPSPSPSETSVVTETPAVEASPSPSPSETPVVEASPSPTPSETPVIDASPSPSPSETPVETLPSPSPASSGSNPPPVTTGSDKAAKTDARPLFDPIIIPIGKPTPASSPKSAPEPTKEKAEPAAQPTPTPVGERSETNAGQPPTETRPRIVEGKEVTADAEIPPCKITASQEKVSLLNNGGSLALVVNFDGSAEQLTSISSSPKDVEVHPEPGVISIPGRQLFVIRSISEKTGMYDVTFGARCGQSKVLVQVR